MGAADQHAAGPRAGGRRYRQALRTRDLRLMMSAFVIDEVGSWSYSVVLAAYVYGRTGSATWIAAVLASRWITGVVVSGPAGVYADRYERTRLIIVGALCSAVVMITMTAVVATDGPLWLLVVASVLATVASAANRPAVGSLTPEVVSEQDLAAANGIFAALENLVVLVGPALGGLLLAVGTPALAIGINAASYLLAAALYARLGVRSRGSAAVGDSMAHQFAEGWRTLVANRVAFVLVLFLVLDSTAFGACSVLFGPLSIHLGTGSDGFSYLIASGALGGVLGAGLADRLAGRPRLASVIIGALALECLPIAGLALTDQPVVASALLVIFGVGMVILDVVGITALQRDISREMLGRVSSIMFGMIMAANTIVSFLASALVTTLGLAGTLTVVGFGIPLLGLLGLPVVVRQDRAGLTRMGDLETRVALLVSLDLFTGAARPVLEQLASAAQDQTVPTGAVLIRQDEPADALYLLAEGALSVSVADADGTIHPRPDVVAPGYVGELGLLRHIPRTATVTTATECRVLRIDATSFFGALETAGASRSMLSLAGERFWRVNRVGAKP